MIKQKSKTASTNVLGSWNTQDFIETCWQKEPLLITAAIPDVQGMISREDLLAIACEPEAEARLILTVTQQKNIQKNIQKNKQHDWTYEQGPFKAKPLKKITSASSSMPWTLLVQSVDQWMPEMAALLKRFDFLPRWRLDDIMVSTASKSGGVGPHFDYYDVFLLQASGTRRWQLGQRCDEHTPLRDHPDMKLLKTFKQTADYTLTAGDMLYIPAGVAHWGTAMDDDCITISIGFRAAAQRELIQMALHKIASDMPDSVRYRDSTQSIDSDPFRINDHALENIKKLWNSLNADQITQSLAQALGEYATEIRCPENVCADSVITLKKLDALLAKKEILELKHNAASRFAYRVLEKNIAELYVDGDTHITSVKMAKAICHLKIHSNLLRTEQDKELLLMLLNQGSMIF